MPPLPAQVQGSPAVQAIYANYESRAEGPRRYLGASQIGKPCERAIWYDFRRSGREKFSGRMLRLFQTGFLEEVRFAQNLRDIGCEVHVVNPETGHQFEVVALGGHFRGHMDGVALNVPEAPKTWHLLEMKTHNNKSFAQLKLHGVQKAKPEHFAQMMVYMHLAQLERALYLAVNKDTDEIYSERIKYDFGEASRILGKARSIIEAKEPPAKIAEDAEKFPCKFCHHADRCHGPDHPGKPAVPVEVNCRTCCHSTPIIDDSDQGGLGTWHCAKHQKTLSEAEQQKGCEDHLFIPGLICFWEPIDSASDPQGDWIEYEDRETGTKFRNGKQKGHYRSIELTVVPADSIGSELVESAKQTLGAVAVTDADIPF